MIRLSGGSHRLTGDLVLMGYVRAMSSQLDVFIAARMRDTTRLPVGPPPGELGSENDGIWRRRRNEK